MAEWLTRGLVIAFVAWIAWHFLQSRYVFQIRIADGQPAVRQGTVTPAFLGRVATACQDAGITNGWVGGVPHGRHVVLRFSRNFPAGLQQRLRNEWLMVG